MVKNKKLKGIGHNAKARKGSNKDLYKEAILALEVGGKEAKNASESLLLDQTVAAKLKMNSKKKKRLEKFMEKELKKDERRGFYEKLSKNTVKASDLLLLSSKKMGKITTKKELLARSLMEERAGLALSNQNVQLVVEKDLPAPFSHPNNEDDDKDDDMIDGDDEVDDDASSSSSDTPAEGGPSLISKLFAPKPTQNKVQVVESSGFGATRVVEENQQVKFGSALKITPPTVTTASKPVTLGSALKGGVSLGSALKKPAVTLGSALKRKEPTATKSSNSKKLKMTESSSDDSSSSEDSSESKEEDTIYSTKGSTPTNQGLWASDIVQGEKSAAKIETINTSVTEKVAPTPPPAQEKVVVPSSKPAYYVKVDRTEDIQVARMSLPVVAEEQPIMEAIMANNVTLLCGETGSGKTTQVPQFLYEAGFGDKKHPDFPGMIGVTQPRRVAAVSMAKRVAQEMNLHDGQVTYQVRYDKAQLGSNTRIKFMTDGILLRELSSLADSAQSKAKKGGDLLLSQYSCIIIDEAHERTVGTDILIGWLTRIVKLRNSGKIQGIGPLKLVIMSATLRVEDFTLNKTLFPADVPPPPVVKVDGRQHKVVIHYNKKTPELDYLGDAFKKVVKIHTKLPHGGVLVFVTGMQEVRVLCRKLEKRFSNSKSPASTPSSDDATQDEDWTKDSSFYDADFDGEGPDDYDDQLELEKEDESDGEEEEEVHILKGTIENEEEEESLEQEDSADQDRGPVHVLPLYSLLSTADQMKVFQPPPNGARLIVVATNVAETSLTIPGIKYVVDCGKAKERCYDTQTGIQNFKVSWTSNASADQRAGRAGRVGPGHCYRLFSSAVFENFFEKHSRPEILRVPIEGVVLNMKSMGINKVVGFPFPTPPDRFQLQDAEKLLQNLEAISSNTQQITGIGKLMAQFPLSPRYAKMLVVAAKQAPTVLLYVIFIVSGLSVGQIFHRDLEIMGDDDKKPVGSDNEEEENEESSPEAKEERKEKRGAFFKTMQVFAGKNPTSDSLMILRAIGTYLAATAKRGSNSKSLDQFCEDHFLRPKAMEEIVKLIQQLVNISNSTFKGISLSLDTLLPPPTKKQESLLRQIILAGYIDCVAKLDETTMSGHGKSAIPTYETIWSTAKEHYVIHPASCVYRERPAPKWIVYDESQAKQQMFGPDGELLQLRAQPDGTKRKFLKGITIISENWLTKQAPALVTIGKVLEQPEPRYHADTDQVKGFISPTFGSKMWALPHCENVLDQGTDASRWFAKALLDGEVGVGASSKVSVNIFHTLKPFLSSKPGIITKSWALNQTKVSQLLLVLGNRNISSKAAILDAWKSDSTFLLDAYLLWLPTEFHATLKKSWPPVVLSAGSSSRMDINMRLVEAVQKLVATYGKQRPLQEE